MISFLPFTSNEIAEESLCDLPELCLIKILRYVDKEGLQEVKLSCKHIYRLLHERKIIRRIHWVKVKLSKCQQKIPPPPPVNWWLQPIGSSVKNECSCEVEIEEEMARPQYGRRLTFKHESTVEFKQFKIGAIRLKESVVARTNIELSNEKRCHFEHHCLAIKLFFEWMAMEYKEYTIARFHIDTTLDRDSLRCWERLTREYGIRAINVEYHCGDDAPTYSTHRLFRWLEPSSLTYYMIENEIWPDEMQEYISSLKSFVCFKYRFSNKVEFNCDLHQFPPHFVVYGGVRVTPKDLGKAIRRWHNGDQNLKQIERLILNVNSPAQLAEQIGLPHSMLRFGFANIVIHKTGSDPLLLRRPIQLPFTWRIYKSLSRWEKLDIFIGDYCLVLAFFFYVFLLYVGDIIIKHSN